MRRPLLFAYSSVVITAMSSAAYAAKDAHHADAHGDHHGAESSGLPQLDPEYFASQIFWLAVMFCVLYILFSNTVLPALSTILENRHEHIQGDLDSAENLRQEAESVQQAYEAILKEANNKASALHVDIENDIKARSENSIAELQEKLMKEISVTEVRLQKAKQESLDEMNTIAAEIASLAAHKIVGIKTDVNQAKDVVKNLRDKKAKAA